MYRIVIPARHGATRLPGKPLLTLAGKPMIQWVHESASRSAAQTVVIATDDERIAAVARGFGADVMMTATTHRSGSDRIAEVARRCGWADDEIIVNVQGDEPLMPPVLIDQVAALLEAHGTADIATLAAPLFSLAALLDPNVVKVVVGATQRALYFSRAPIPWNRDAAACSADAMKRLKGTRRHIGIYAYRVAALRHLAALPPGVLEELEKLEQLRALEQGMDIRVADCVVAPGPDVNTRDDLARVEELLTRRS